MFIRLVIDCSEHYQAVTQSPNKMIIEMLRFWDDASSHHQPRHRPLACLFEQEVNVLHKAALQYIHRSTAVYVLCLYMH
eukprot:jgi/Chrzof1/5047/Cz15g09230.t1